MSVTVLRSNPASPRNRSFVRRAALPGTVTLVLIGVVAYLHGARSPVSDDDSDALPRSPEQTAAVRSEEAAVARSNAPQSPSPSPTNPPAAQQTTGVSAETLTRLIAETRSADLQTRFNAIAALADAPRSTAIPALERVLEAGEPGVDRLIALQSLHTLALAQGDEDQRIRSAMRAVVYHGDDEDAAQNAQALLEDIESEFAQRNKSR